MSVAIYSAIDGNGTEISRFGAFRGELQTGYPPILGIANAFSWFASLLSPPRPFNELVLEFYRRQSPPNCLLETRLTSSCGPADCLHSKE